MWIVVFGERVENSETFGPFTRHLLALVYGQEIQKKRMTKTPFHCVWVRKPEEGL